MSPGPIDGRSTAADSAPARTGGGLTRRRYLLAAATAATGTLAGCSSRVESYEFRADPVVLPEPVRTERRYREQVREEVTDERTGSVQGSRVTVTIKSQLVVYAPEDHEGPITGDGSAVTPSRPTVGVLATPNAVVLGRSMNPAARVPLSELLTGNLGGRLARELGLSSDEVDWVRGPTAVDADSPAKTTLLGKETAVESFAGVVSVEDGPAFVLLQVARANVGDESVVAATAWGKRVRTAEGPLVDDDGFVTRETFEANVEAAASLIAALKRD